jgi:hypothetical protein
MSDTQSRLLPTLCAMPSAYRCWHRRAAPSIPHNRLRREPRSQQASRRLPAKEKAMNKQLTLAPLTVALIAGFTLAACSPREDASTARSPNDPGAVVQTAPTRAGDVREDTRQAVNSAGEATRSAADAVGDKVGDAAITTSINAELAKDERLSPLKINVDTSDGRVALHGTAPDAASKDRAALLAQNVKGVKSVDNQLTVSGNQ